MIDNLQTGTKANLAKEVERKVEALESKLAILVHIIEDKMGCFNDPTWKVCGWWGGGVADTNYLYPARWGWIKK